MIFSKKSKNFIFLFIVAFLFKNNQAFSTSSPRAYERFWVQYSEENSILFRFVTDSQNEKCPSVFFDDSKIQTIERKHFYKKEFPVKICQAVFYNDQKDHLITFQNHEIKIKGHLQKISTIGDTGCVVKTNKLTGKGFEQDCLDPAKYPFKINAQKIAKENSDLIVHVGDYYYTETKCEDESKCLGRPFGDNFLTWRADFLDSAISLFEAAPIILTRGNHEDCKRGGKGWAVLFDNSIKFKECSEYDSAFKIKFQNIDFFMIDSSHSQDLIEIKNDEERKKVEFFSFEFQKLLRDLHEKKTNVLLTHRPVFAWELEEWKKESRSPNPVNLILNDAFLSVSNKNLKNLDFVLSGHIHMGALIKIKNSKKHFNVIQVISGNGGTNLNTARHYIGQKSIFNRNNRVFSYNQFNNFGYTNIFLNKNKKENQIEFMNLKA